MSDLTNDRPTVVAELDAAIARYRGERAGVTDGPWEHVPETHADHGGADTYHHVLAQDQHLYVGGIDTDADARHIAAWADPSVTDDAVAAWQALRDAAFAEAWSEAELTTLECAVLAQVRTYMSKETNR